MTPQPHNDGFDDAIKGFHTPGPYQHTEYTDPHPYGIPVNSAPVKPGPTKRGKVVISLGAAVLATGALLTWQNYEADAKASEVQAQELQYKRDLLALEMQKEHNKANAANQKVQETHDAAQQKQVQACVDADKGLIGKQLGVTYGSVLEDCQSQYGTSSTGADMQEAASATDTDTGGGGLNEGVLIGGGVLVLGLVVTVRKFTRPSHV